MAALFSVVVCLMALSVAFAFKPVSFRSRTVSSILKLSDNDSPSDMEADFATTSTSSSTGQMVNEVLDAMGGVDAKPMIKEFFATDESCSSLTRSEINEYVLEVICSGYVVNLATDKRFAIDIRTSVGEDESYHESCGKSTAQWRMASGKQWLSDWFSRNARVSGTNH